MADQKADKKDAPKDPDAAGAPLLVPAREYEKREEKRLVLDGMSEADIECLHRTDPFMYYSIPGVRRAAVLHRVVDYSDVAALGGDRRHVRRHSAPAGLGGTTVRRCTAISFEAYPDVLLGDLMGGFD